jgi:hypothetical protein
MHPLIYVDGWLADQLGSRSLTDLADVFSTLAGKPVDILIHGHSDHHADARYTGKVIGSSRGLQTEIKELVHPKIEGDVFPHNRED